MSYFLPSYLQKRILRYALSKVQLLDTDALDLDNLDIGWGRQSTIELREVGVQTEKLAALLNLPPPLAIVSAQILFLRLTVPADLYKSGILVDVHGVKICVNVDFEDQGLDQGNQLDVRKAPSEKLARAAQGRQAKDQQSYPHDPGGTRHSSEDGDQISGHIPTPVDLAKSFLHTEAGEGKSDLQAFVTDSQYLAQSQISSEHEDKTLALGVGNNLTLPAFLADFIKGVGDRIQLKVRELQLDLTLKVDRAPESSSGSDGSDRLEDVTIRLAVDNIHVDGVTNSDPTTEGAGGEETSKQKPHTARRITLSTIEAMIITEASLFSNLARSTAPSSPVTFHTRNLAKSNSDTSPAPMSSASPREGLVLPDFESSDSRVRREYIPGLESTENHAENVASPLYAAEEHYDSMLADPSYVDGKRMDDGGEPMEDSGTFLKSFPYSDSGGYLDSSQSSMGSRHRSRRGKSHSEQTPPATFNVYDDASPLEGATKVFHGLGLQDQQIPSNHRAPKIDFGGGSEPSHPVSDRSSPASEDLAQSKIFTHEEASMYMSAISEASNGREDRETSIPGNWVSNSRDESEQRMPYTRREAAMIYKPGHEPLSQVCDPKSAENPIQQAGYAHNRSLYGDTFSSNLAANINAETTSVNPPPIEDDASIPCSETSSANLKSSFTIVKRIITINAIVLCIPLSPKSLDVRAELHAQRSDEEKNSMPGGFGRASESSTASITSESLTMTANLRNSKTCSIEIDNVQAVGDVGLIKMMVLVSQRMSTLLHPRMSHHRIKRSLSPPLSENREWQVTIKEASWKFLDAVKGRPVLQAPHESRKQDAQTFSGNSEVLLRASLERFHIVYSKTAATTSTTTISMGKFSIGYNSEDILSFNSGMKMRHSTSDVFSPVGRDVVLTIERSSNSIKYDLRTLPVHIALDLRRLDETFSWFGGFSSMLGLGSSMMSTMTVVDAKSNTSRSRRSNRGVHFESPGTNRATKTGAIPPQCKVTARIGGLMFDLEGTQSSLRFESTAMKLVTRAEGLGLQVDRIKFSGPYSKHTSSEPTIAVKVTNLRVEYLPTPKEVDLARLLELLSLSQDKEARDDDILLERLICQRKQGTVARASIEKLDGTIKSLQDLRCFSMLAEDLKKLSTVTKYLPEDDRAGLLILALVQDLRLEVTVNNGFGVAKLSCKNTEGAHVTFPSLTTLSIATVNLHRNDAEELLGGALPLEVRSNPQLPTFMARFVGNEMEPTAKVKFLGLRVEYHVSTAMAVMGLQESSVTDWMVAELVSSVATLTSRQIDVHPPKLSKQNSAGSDGSTSNSKTLRLDISFRDSIIGLNPRKSSARGLIVLTDTHFLGAMPRDKEANAVLDVRKASVMVIDDVDQITPTVEKTMAPESLDVPGNQVVFLSTMGYVSVGTVSSAKATIQVIGLEAEVEKAIEVDVKDDLFVLESCADSTQTIQCILNGLSPPTPPSTEPRYRTEVVPIEDMLASLTGNVSATTRSSTEVEESPLELDEGDMMDDEVPHNLEFVSSFYNPEPDAVYDQIANSMLEDDLNALASPSMVREIGKNNFLESFQELAQVAPGHEPLDFREGHFGTSSAVGGTAHRWDIGRDTYALSDDKKLRSSPLRIRVRDVHFIWNLFDGYDWQHTRDTISEAVEAVQTKATERLSRKDKRKTLDPEEEEQSVIGDFLFNSIYIGIPANRDPRELARQVNRNIDDLVSEPESNATSTASSSLDRQGHLYQSKGRKLRLKRSRHHKMTFELKGISADVVVFPPNSGETQSSIDVRIQDLEVFDHVPTSTWKKFATYMHDAGERESGMSMIHLEILNVKPVPDLAASEIILKATILPLRLHVDQDALDFLTRFFEFKDDAALVHTPKPEPPFFQRVEINSLQVRLDFKPKRVDYAGIRSGHTTEFMNFFVLDRADMVLRHVILRGGISGLDKVGKMLNDIWMPDVKRNQLPGILAGLAPVRSLVNVGGGVRDLVAIPIREYRKDGRVVRSFQKGAVAFARTTTGELVKLGAKLAIGTQTMLQGAEDLFAQTPTDRSDVLGGWEIAELDEEEKKQISLYADQPIGVMQGLRGAYASLEQDLLSAKDAIVAIPGEIMESGTAKGAAKAVLRGAPTVILRPAMGVSKAVGQTLMGATNSLDPGNRRRIEDKYKRH